MTEHPASRALFDLSVTDRESVPLVGGVVSTAASLLRLDPVAAAQLNVVAQELTEAVVTNAFDGGEQIDVTAAVERIPGGLKVVLTDRGAPSTLAHQSGCPPRVADLVRLGFADSVRFENHGRHGNRAELFKRLDYPTVVGDPGFQRLAHERPRLDRDERGHPVITERPMTAADVLEVSRLFFRCQGHSPAVSEYIYQPDRFTEYVKAGKHLGTVAVTASGRIVGHIATKVLIRDATVGQLGQVVVEPDLWEYGVGNRLSRVHLARMRELGFTGHYGQALASDTRRQQVAVDFGAHEVALTLAAQPDTSGPPSAPDQQIHRSALLWFYTGSGQEPARRAHAPASYRDRVEEILARAGVPRDLPAGNPRLLSSLPPSTSLEMRLRHDANAATIEVGKYGQDFLERLQQHLQELRINRYAMAVLFLPLTDPLTAVMAGGLQELGFHFSGVLPEFRDGDMLLLVWLNDVPVDPDLITPVSDFGQALRDWVLGDYAEVVEVAARQQRSRTTMARIYESLQ